eukprot:GGOE01014073.1.p1 GENE.GGOE01014073.1~~GGOE01014073.1.p1  ORF type:complete len:430 (-),score=47.03 GGOE01014073.1:108-1397(-)
MPPINEVALVYDAKSDGPKQPASAPLLPDTTSPKPSKHATKPAFSKLEVPGTVTELRGAATTAPAGSLADPSNLANGSDSSSQSHSTSNSPEVTPNANAARKTRSKGKGKASRSRSRSRSVPSDGHSSQRKPKSVSEWSSVMASSALGKPQSHGHRSRSVSSASCWRPESEFSHLFGKSWSSRMAMPDSNHASTTPRMRFQPLWASDVSLEIPPEVSRTGRQRSHSAAPCFRSSTSRIAVPHVTGQLGPGSYTIPDNVTRTGCSLRRGDLSRAAFAAATPKSGQFPVPASSAVGPGSYDPTATDIAVVAKKKAAVPSATFRSAEPRCKSLDEHLRVTLSVPPPGTYFEAEEKVNAKAANAPSAVFRSQSARCTIADVRPMAALPGPGQYHVPIDYNIKPSRFAFGGTSPRFPRVPIPNVPPPGAYDVVW